MPTVELILIIAAFLCGGIAIVESRGRNLAGWGVALIALVLLLPVMPR